MSDNAAVQAFINAGRVPAGTYNIDCSSPLIVPSNTNLQIEGTLAAIPNNLPVSAVIELNGASNVNVTGGIIVGDIFRHTDSGGGRAGGLISVLNSSNISISGTRLGYGWADGVYLQNNKSVTLSGVSCLSCGRNGMSIISGQGVVVTGCLFADTHSVAPFPQAGIDLEPDNPSEMLLNVSITGNTFQRNTGAGVYIGFTPRSNIAGISVVGNTFDQHYKNGSGPPIRGINTWYGNLCYTLFRWIPGYDWWFFKSEYSV